MQPEMDADTARSVIRALRSDLDQIRADLDIVKSALTLALDRAYRAEDVVAKIHNLLDA